MKKTVLLFAVLFSLSSFTLRASNDFIITITPQNFLWNPHLGFTSTENQIYSALFEGLVIADPKTLQPIPALAETWEISEDGKTYTFTLRENLTFSDGSPLTAYDFKRSWLGLLQQPKAQFATLLEPIKGANAFHKGEIKSEKVGIKVLSERELEVTLIKRTPHFLSILTHYTLVPIHHNYIHLTDWSIFSSFPVNGPFTIKKSEPGKIFMVQNENYWDRENLKLDSLTVIMEHDPFEASQAFNRNETYWITSNFDYESLTHPTLSVSPQFSTSFFFFNSRRPLGQNSKVTRALALLIPWNILHSIPLIPAVTLVPPFSSYNSPSSGGNMAEGIVTQNYEEAVSLLEEAGYPMGKGLDPIVISSPYPKGEDERATILKYTWEEILEVEVIIDPVPSGFYYNFMDSDNYDLALMSWIGDYADPLSFLDLFRGDSSLNSGKYKNEQYDNLLEEASKLSGDERFKALSEAETILLQEGQVIPLAHSPAINVIDTRFIDGWYPNPLDNHPFKFISFSTNYYLPGTT